MSRLTVQAKAIQLNTHAAPMMPRSAPAELLEVDLAVAVAVGLIDHLLQLLVRHVLPKLPVIAGPSALRTTVDLQQIYLTQLRVAAWKRAA